MQTLNDFTQSQEADNIINDIIDNIDDIKNLTYSTSNKMKQIIEDNRFEILESFYQKLVSDFEDYEYEKHKEDKYFDN